MSKRAQYVVLCEDLQAQVFVCRILRQRGVNHRRIHRLALPATTTGGAGDVYVLAKFPEQVRAFRVQNAKTSTALLVHVDADPRHTVVQRHEQLASALRKAGMVPRASDEPIVELVPKRNIETWLYALDPTLATDSTRPLDEIVEFPKLGCESGCDGAAAAFAEYARSGDHPAAASVPSLVDGLREFRRLP